MAYASGVRLSSLAGLVGAAVGGYIGYTQAADVSDLTPVTGALILGGVGLVAGSAGAFLLKSVMQFLIYAIMLGVVVFVFQNQIEALTGINPCDATIEFLRDFGLPVACFLASIRLAGPKTSSAYASPRRPPDLLFLRR